MDNELVVDSFAGGGGASLGIAWAVGRAPDIAINHDEEALAMHEANHPSTLHVREDVVKANLRKLVGGRRVGALWLSPDCKHFSRAKGAKPVKKEIRSLAWIACKWAEQEEPRVIFLENVREFADWGPLVPQLECRECDWRGTEGQAVLVRTRRRCPRCESLKLRMTEQMVPCPDRKGLTFKRFCGRLRNLGYKVEYRNLDAADYGAPTHRKRLFLIARRDGAPIVWPEPTHAAPNKLNATPLFDRLKPYRTAAECIDWSLPCPSIFDRKKPLAEKTLRRIALGIKRYVLDNPSPFIVQTSHTGTTGRGSYSWPGDEPLRTLTGASEHAVVTPILSQYHGQKANESRCQQPGDPFNTLDTQPRYAVVAPTLIEAAHGSEGRWGDGTKDLQKPLGTIHAGGGNHAIAAAYVVKHFGGMVGVPAETPLPTTTMRGTQNQVVTAHLARHFGKSIGQSVDQPAPTETANPHTYLVAGSLVQRGYGERDGQEPRALDVQQPLGTVVAGGVKHGCVAANLVHMNHGDKQWNEVEEPMRTVTSSNHAALVYSFLVKYFGTAVGADVNDPLSTVTAKDRCGLVTVMVQGEPYVIVDIGMRMLTPRELARAQGFPDTYILTGTKTSQVARIGNSVCPQIAKALVEANYATNPVPA